ncbi:hypothetical protein BJ170DRAFT_380744 [Xylariales sp. AK1849]|nr:hypothetical protein BJ170DRAFT_380744 [Xylariales sp. AK1849]
MAGPGRLKRRRESVSGAASQETESTERPTDEQPTQVEHTEPASKKARVEANRSLFVRALGPNVTDESLTEFFSNHYPVKHATVVKDKATKLSRGYGFVTFTDASDAVEAKEKLHGQKLDGRPVNIELAEARERRPTATDPTLVSQKEQRKAALADARKPPKLIVRNLPWSIRTSDQLAALFRSFGLVKFADLPQDKGKLKGFGFVTLRGRPNAEKALEAINGKTVDGRTLAVDWAVGKQEWTKQQEQEEEVETGAAVEQTKTSTKKASDDTDKNSEKDEGDEEEDEDLRNFMQNHMENLENEDSEDDAADDEDAELGSDHEEDAVPAKPLMTSNNTTLFVRNIPFTTDDAQLKSHFEQFGAIRYARVVVDRATDRPAGTGFVCFVSEADSKSCLKGGPRPQPIEASGKRSILQDEMADVQGLYTLEGRILQVSQAVSKDEATRLTADGVAARDGKDKDKRRVYLLAEGTISNGSALYSLLTPTDIKMREESAIQRKKQIQSNPSLHLSLTRLAIRNVPRNITSKELKALAREAVVGFAKDVKEGRRQPLSKEEVTRGGDDDKDAEHKRREKGKGVVKQSKVVFENKEGSKVAEADGAGKSRGYGFIEYSSHRWALMGLRWLNGHALKNEAGKTQRLIVEFAIENAQVVARRMDFQAKSFNRGGEHQQNTMGPYQSKFANNRDNGPRDNRMGSNKSRFTNGRSNPRDEPAHKKFAAARVARKGKPAKPEGGGESKSGARDVLEQNIVGRKRAMRKKKANARKG